MYVPVKMLVEDDFTRCLVEDTALQLTRLPDASCSCFCCERKRF